MAVIGMATVALGVPRVAVRRHEDVGATPSMMGPVLRDAVLQRLNGSVFLLPFILTASFLAVPAIIEGPLAVARDAHWKVYLPVLVLSLLAMYPLLRLSERGGRPVLALRLGVVLMAGSLVVLLEGTARGALLAALVVFFAAVNYLEAALPSQVSKAVFAHGKGTALGIYATCQFLGAFAGGTTGGLVSAVAGPSGLLWLVVGAALLWLLLIWNLEPRPATIGAGVEAS
jgi:hypothetical protein